MNKRKLILSIVALFLVGCVQVSDSAATSNNIINDSQIASNDTTSEGNNSTTVIESTLTSEGGGVASFDVGGLSLQSLEPEPAKPEIWEYTTSDFVKKNVIDYYQGVTGLHGWKLKRQLYYIIRGHDKISYSGPALISYQDFYRELDADPHNPNNIIYLYSGSANNRTPFDREHVWPKSLGLGGSENYQSMLSGVDVHNLRPATGIINTSRNNKEWDYATGTADNLIGNKSDSKVFEPIDAFKGDVARTIFYMATRYEGYERINGVEHQIPDLELTVNTGNKFVEGNKVAYLGNVETLLQWHDLDPVDEVEVQRNNLIYQKYQHNRNPYIDHPEFADMVFDPNYNGSAASNANPVTAESDLPRSLNSGITDIVNGTKINETFFENASGVTNAYAGNNNKTFTADGNQWTISSGRKSAARFTLGRNDGQARDEVDSAFDLSSGISTNSSSLVLNISLANVNAVMLRYTNATAESISSYHIFRSTDNGASYQPLSTWVGYDGTFQRGLVFTPAANARFALVIAGNYPRLEIISMSFYQNGALSY